ncbi:MAG TPA: alpha/beta hydrolase, partial [Sphingomicrobium sp.]
QAIFVGTSLGGLVTLAIAAIAPERIAAAILNDVGPELGDAGLDHIRRYVGKGERFASWDEAAQVIRGNQHAAFPNYEPADWLAAAHRHCREREGRVVFDYDPAIADAFRLVEATPKVDMWPLFAALARKPLLVVRGELSELLRPETLERMREAAPEMNSVIVPQVGHAPMLDEPEAAAAIDSFLASLDD